MATPLPRRIRPSRLLTARLDMPLVALGLLAFACSAPADGEDADGPPEFMGTIPGVTGQAPSQSSNPANPTGGGVTNPSAPGTPPAPGAANPPPSSGAGGSAGTEPVGSAPVGLDPNAGVPPSSGAAGSSMVGGDVGGDSSGAGGSSFEPTDPGQGEPTGPGNDPGTPVEPPPQPTPEPPPSNPPPSNPPPQPAPNAGCGNAFFCDGFESVAAGASPNAALWSVIENYSPREQSANVQISAANARSGNQALRVLPEGRTGIVADLPAQTYFMRAWIQADAVPRGPVFIGLGSTENSETRLRISEQSYATINTVGPGDAVRPGAATSGNCADCITLVPNRWFCAEFFIDNASQNATMWIDGVEAASIVNGDGGWPVQPATPRLFVGSMPLQGGQTAVWIDDVAAGPQRIGCD